MENYCETLMKIKKQLPVFGYGNFYELQRFHTEYKKILTTVSSEEKYKAATGEIVLRLPSIERLLNEGRLAMTLKERRRYFVGVRKELISNIDALRGCLQCLRQR